MKWGNLKTNQKFLLGFGFVVLLTLFISIISIISNVKNSKRVQILIDIENSNAELLNLRLYVRSFLVNLDNLKNVDKKENQNHFKALRSTANADSTYSSVKSFLDENVAKQVHSYDSAFKFYREQLLDLKTHADKVNEALDLQQKLKDDYFKLNISGTKITSYLLDVQLNVQVLLRDSRKEENYKQMMIDIEKSAAEANVSKNQELISIIRQYKESSEILYLNLKKLSDTDKTMRENMMIMRDSLKEIINYLETQAIEQNKLASLRLIIIAIISVVISIIISYIITKFITQNMNKGVQLAKNFASGSLDHTFSESDLSYKDEIGELNNALFIMGNKFKEIITEVLKGAEFVASASRQINSTTVQISSGASEQSASIEELMASMEEMLSNLLLSAEYASNTKKISLKTFEGLKNLNEVSQKSLNSVELITQKSSIISEIAFQTNILALNAAVEAARAGAYGKSFSVVATEVRKLAEKTKAASEEISLLSSESLLNTKNAVEQMNIMVPIIEESVSMIEKIVLSSDEQKIGAEQINNAVVQLNSVSQQNAASSEELSSNAEQLAEEAQKLREILAFFNVKE